MTVAKRLSRFFRKTDGSATVEFVLWVPIFVLIMGLVVDVSMAMTMQSRFYDVARDASRQVALGIKTSAQAKSIAAQQLGVTEDYVNISESAEWVATTISVPYSEIVIFSSSLPVTGNLEASVSMLSEASVSAVGS